MIDNPLHEIINLNHKECPYQELNQEVSARLR